jgi:hypothetical protein
MADANMIPGIKLPATLGAALGVSPEEAAKTFAAAVTAGMAQVMANAIAQALAQAAGGAVGAAPPDWVKLIKGPVIEMLWGTPGNTTVRRVNAVAINDGAATGPALGGMNIGVGCGGVI